MLSKLGVAEVVRADLAGAHVFESGIGVAVQEKLHVRSIGDSDLVSRSGDLYI